MSCRPSHRRIQTVETEAAPPVRGRFLADLLSKLLPILRDSIQICTPSPQNIRITKERTVKNLSRRDFLRFGAAGVAGIAGAVSFPMLGRGLPLASPGSDFFTIAVISDTQNYVDVTHRQPLNVNFFLSQTKYLADNMNTLNLAFATHVGDVVQHGDGTNGTAGDNSYGAGAEWDKARAAMDVLAATGLPFGMSIGNHDYDNFSYKSGRLPLASTVGWRKFFGSGSAYFAGKSWYGGASDNLAVNPGLSSCQTFAASGRKFLHISLELEPGDKAIAWAQGVIDSHPGSPTIITTHSYLSPPPWGDDKLPLVEPAPRNPARHLVASPAGWNDATSLWNKLIAPNDQVFLVLCGHSWTPANANGVSKGENIRIDNNKAGHPVYQVLTDYQGNTSLGSGGGDGWYRFMQFDMEKNSIHFTTRNSYANKYAGQDGASTFDQPPGFSDFSLDMPVQVLKAHVQADIVSPQVKGKSIGAEAFTETKMRKNERRTT